VDQPNRRPCDLKRAFCIPIDLRCLLTTLNGSGSVECCVHDHLYIHLSRSYHINIGTLVTCIATSPAVLEAVLLLHNLMSTPDDNCRSYGQSDPAYSIIGTGVPLVSQTVLRTPHTHVRPQLLQTMSGVSLRRYCISLCCQDGVHIGSLPIHRACASSNAYHSQEEVPHLQRPV